MLESAFILQDRVTVRQGLGGEKVRKQVSWKARKIVGEKAGR